MVEQLRDKALSRKRLSICKTRLSSPAEVHEHVPMVSKQNYHVTQQK